MKTASKASKKGDASVSPFQLRYQLRPDAGWADAMAADLSGMPLGQRELWLALLDDLAAARPQPPAESWKDAERQASSACLVDWDYPHPDLKTFEPGTAEYSAAIRGAYPGSAWHGELERHIASIGTQAVSDRIAAWVGAATRSGVGSLNRVGANREMLRALIWAASAIKSEECADALRQLGAFATAHNTAQGVTVALALTATENESALGALHLLAHAAKRPTSRGRFFRGALHIQRRLGLTAEDAAERFIPTYGLAPGGSLRVQLGAASGEIRVDGVRAALHWFDAHGKEVRSPPAAARREFPAEIRDLKASAKAIGSMLLAQRDRLDRLVGTVRSWPFVQFKSCYLDHPLVGTLARRMIWTCGGTSVLFSQDGIARRVSGEAVDCVQSVIGVWHPIGRTADDVLAWRNRLAELGITQPFKQAHREIYVLTDAERATQTYSNRFAGHVLRQHQFAQLARGRGWAYGLRGGWDSGDTGAATRLISSGELRVEFWITSTGYEPHAPSGILLQVSTDQVRFCRPDTNDAVPLHEIAPLVFSETMRDVDLFVGVASIGNDPTWQDDGPEGRHRTYWESYSFGELTQTAQTRREVLESLLPRLTKIRDRCSLSERFLVVRGDLRTYKIHLGSGNILMEPNDQYLCIVPSRATSDVKPDVFLPFEGDGTLSVILSKAFLLAEDRKIKDPTITRQIKS